MADAILHCVNLNLSMHFRVGSRNPAIFNMKLYRTTVNNSFQSLPIFHHKELHLRCCIGLALNFLTWFTKILEDIWAHSSLPAPMIEYSLGKIWKTHPPRCSKNTYLEVFSIKFSFLHLISNGLHRVNYNSLK